MWRVSIVLLTAASLLGGCVGVTCANYPGATCYAPGPPAGPYPYAPGVSPGAPYGGADGLSYVDGYPVGVIDGAAVPLTFAPAFGGWGYYDGFHHWRGAPPGMREQLRDFHPNGPAPPPGGPRGEFGRGPPAPGGPPAGRGGFVPGARAPGGGAVQPAAAAPPVRRPLPPPPARSCPNGQPRC